jgi:hypothetical protein
VGGGRLYVKTMIKGAFKRTKNTLNMIVVRNMWIMHKQTGLLDGKGNFRTSDSEILESTGKTTIKRSIGKWMTSGGELRGSISRCVRGLTVKHTSTG